MLLINKMVAATLGLGVVAAALGLGMIAAAIVFGLEYPNIVPRQ